MPNPVLERLVAQRAEQMAAMDSVLGQVEDRDLVDAERSLLTASQERIAELDAQIRPLRDYEAMRAAHEETVGQLPRPDGVTSAPRPIAVHERAPAYRTTGAFLVDYVRANGILDRNNPDQEAAARIYHARADQTTADTPGLLPVPLIGQVVSLVDARRPLIGSLGGARALGGIPGKSFGRPTVSTHTTVGPQSAEKTALPSQKMSITSVTFNKVTHGGYVDISRQDIDWTSPSAWDILVRDLADQYATDTEATVAGNFAGGATGTTPALPAAPVLADWTKALYTAAMHSYQSGLKMPDRIWCSLDVWAALGSLVDAARVVMPTNGNLDTAAGTSTLADWRGDVLGLPRVVVPTFPAKTCIVGPSDLYEVYEDTIGLLSVIEPSILGVQVAYGGYLAFGSLHPTAYVKVDLSAVTSLPTLAELDTDGDTDGDAGTGRASKK